MYLCCYNTFLKGYVTDVAAVYSVETLYSRHPWDKYKCPN